MKLDRGDDNVKGVIQLDSMSGGDIAIGEEFQLVTVSADIILIHLQDGDADMKKVGGIFISTGAVNKKLWRTGKVILVGKDVTEYNVDDYVVFPNDRGLNTKSVNVKGHGIVKNGVFLNEYRIFGRCEMVQAEDPYADEQTTSS